MIDNNLAKKIITLRNQKGYSQQRLADESKLGLRTIQRIENGETSPRNDTLNRIFDALGVFGDGSIYKSLKDQKWFLHLMNLSPLVGIIIQPIFGILPPILFWLLKRDEVSLVDNYGKKIIQFQSIWIIIIYIIFFLASLGRHIEYNFIFFQILSAFKTLGFNAGSFYILFSLILYLFNISFIIANHIRIQRGLNAKMYPTIK